MKILLVRMVHYSTNSESVLSVLGIVLCAGDTAMGKKVGKRLDPQQPTFLEGTGK